MARIRCRRFGSSIWRSCWRVQARQRYTRVQMKITRATQSYEAWLGERIVVLPGDVKKKHAEMAKDVFPFLRAPFYRWMQLWPVVCAAENPAPKVLAGGARGAANFDPRRDRA